MVYEMPVLNVMGREMTTFGDLQKTLANLGLNKGTGLLRLSFKQTDQPIEEAMRDIGEYFKEEQEPRTAAQSSRQQSESVTDAIAKVPSPEKRSEESNMDLDASDTTPDSTPTPADASTSTHTTPSNSAASPDPITSSTTFQILGPDGLPLTIYSAPSNTTPLAALTPYNESDFMPSIRQAKEAQARLASGTHNTKLLSYAEEVALEAEKVARLSKIKEIPLRIRFPDQMSVSKSITSANTGNWLYEYVRGLINWENEPFKLVWMGNKGKEVIPSEGGKFLINDVGIQGPTVVSLSWGGEEISERLKGKPILKEMYREKATKQPVPVLESESEKIEESTKEDVKKDDGGGERKKRGLQSLIMKNLKKR